MTQLSLGELGGIVLAPDVLEEQRGAWCSPLNVTAAVGTFYVDPFTNPRSTLKALLMCMLERGDDGFGLKQRSTPGTFYVNPTHCKVCRGTQSMVVLVGDSEGEELQECDACGYHVATEDTTVWIQPPYDIVQDALDHFGHTRYTALLRLDTSTAWFDWLWNSAEVIMVPWQDRCEFVPPPGVKASSNPFPHGLFYRRSTDVPDAVRAFCLPWPTPRYPWQADPLELTR